jgi:hypothetical protein
MTTRWSARLTDGPSASQAQKPGVPSKARNVPRGRLTPDDFSPERPWSTTVGPDEVAFIEVLLTPAPVGAKRSNEPRPEPTVGQPSLPMDEPAGPQPETLAAGRDDQPEEAASPPAAPPRIASPYAENL